MRRALVIPVLGLVLRGRRDGRAVRRAVGLAPALAAGPTSWPSCARRASCSRRWSAPRSAVAGVAMQSLLQNDLADPYVLGLSGGASAGAVTSLALAPGLPPGPAAGAGALGRGDAGALARARTVRLRRACCWPASRSARSARASPAWCWCWRPSSRLLRSSTYWLFGGFGTPAWSSLIAPAVLLVGGGTLG